MSVQEPSSILDRGERLIWSGRPAPLGYAIKKTGFQWFFGLFFFGFSLFWICMAGTMGPGAGNSPGRFFWIFGIPFVLIGSAFVLSPAYHYLKAGRTAFLLTDRRAVIDSGGFQGKRVSIPLREVPFIELRLGANGTGHVLFTEEALRYQRGLSRRDGFIAITAAADVERKLRDAIEAQAREPARTA